MRVQKTFSTFLRNNPEVEEKAQRLSSTLNRPLTKKLPGEFNPIKVWGNFLSPVRNQGACGDCYAQSVVSVLTDRFNLLTLGQFFQTLSAREVTVCDGALMKGITPSNTAEVNMQAHSTIGCTGNTIYNVVEFLYMYGAVPRTCFDSEIAKSKGFDLQNLTTDSSLPFCSQMIGIDFNKCLDGKTPARFFRIVSKNNVGNDPQEIKHAIYHWGPVASGFMIYSNFLNGYDGTTIYMGPGDTDTLQGGHAIKILGWGQENGVEYWWCCNSWGVSWGLLGYFRMKINCGCDLENNVIEFLPDIPTISELGEEYFDYKPLVDENDAKQREWFSVDPNTGYKYSALREMKKNGIVIKPLFNIDRLPDYSKFYAGEIENYPYGIIPLPLTGSIGKPIFSENFIIFSMIIGPAVLILIIRLILHFFRQ